MTDNNWNAGYRRVDYEFEKNNNLTAEVTNHGRKSTKPIDEVDDAGICNGSKIEDLGISNDVIIDTTSRFSSDEEIFDESKSGVVEYLKRLGQSNIRGELSCSRLTLKYYCLALDYF